MSRFRNNIADNYPIAFITDAGFLFKKHPSSVSFDGTPRYISNPRSDATYDFHTCLKEYEPLYRNFNPGASPSGAPLKPKK